MNAPSITPTTSPLRRFQRIAAATSCAFARTAVLWEFAPWDGACSLAENIRAQAPLMERFCAQADPLALDGIVLELPGSFGSTVEGLAHTIGELIAVLAAEDPDHGASLETAVDRPGWWLTFAGVQLFVLTFAPCYGPDHPRWDFGADAVFVVFRPRAAFIRRRRGSPSLSPELHGRIREAYARSGQPYDAALAESEIEAHQFVKPIAVGDAPVRWWPDRAGQADA